MAYTPYNQALPDTSRYNIDPVLLERLYQPARQDPYQAGMLSTQNTDYYTDPFGYTNKKFGVGTPLDELLKKEGSAEGLFSPPTPINDSSGGGDFGGFGNDGGTGQTGTTGGMSPNMGGVIGAVLGGLLGVGPMIGYYGGKALATNANNSAANAMPVDPGVQAAVQAQAQAQAQAAVNAQANAMPVDPGIQAAINAQAQAAAQASNVAEGGGGYSGPGGVGGSGVSAGGGNAAGGFGIGGW
tara:strand:+ start:119 stop:841 length:723 start_codon:yes stop_codon:yes gene_type:complete